MTPLCLCGGAVADARCTVCGVAVARVLPVPPVPDWERSAVREVQHVAGAVAGVRAAAVERTASGWGVRIQLDDGAWTAASLRRLAAGLHAVAAALDYAAGAAAPAKSRKRAS